MPRVAAKRKSKLCHAQPLPLPLPKTAAVPVPVPPPAGNPDKARRPKRALKLRLDDVLEVWWGARRAFVTVQGLVKALRALGATEALDECAAVRHLASLADSRGPPPPKRDRDRDQERRRLRAAVAALCEAGGACEGRPVLVIASSEAVRS